jgi:hypothetical protein
MYDVSDRDEVLEAIPEPEPRPRRRAWHTASERAELASAATTLRTAPFAGGASASQIIAIRTAWDTAVSPFSEPARARAVADLLRAAGEAKWSAAELCAWVDTQVADVTAARTVVLDELRARLTRAA